MNQPKPVFGRPKDDSVSTALKAAALRMVQREGYRHVTIASITREAGVARQSLYNRWNTKADLVLAALADTGMHADGAFEQRDLGSSRARLAEFLTIVFVRLDRDADILRSLIAAAQDDPEFGAAFHSRFVAPREAMVMKLLREAQHAGEIPVDRNIGVISAMIHGAFWYRLLNRLPLDAALAEGLAAEAFHG